MVKFIKTPKVFLQRMVRQWADLLGVKKVLVKMVNYHVLRLDYSDSVINIKLFCNLITIFKLCKTHYFNLGKALLFPRNQVICLEN